MQNKQMNPIKKTDQVDEIIKRLRGTSRLSGNDKKVFAINLGSLAFRLNEKNPRFAAKQIVEHSGQAGIWEKRKRFFRFPDEEAPEFGKEGEYASSPITFIVLAEAAGKLLSNSSQDGAIEREKKIAIRDLIRGSSFMPIYVPSSNAEISAAGLLSDYRERLSEALEQRTKITELWLILETTEIDINTFFKNQKEKATSPFGESANVPKEILEDFFRNADEQVGLFTPSIYGSTNYWSSIFVNIGHIATIHKIKMFCIPESKRSAFYGTDREKANALTSMGFKVQNFDDTIECFPKYSLDDHEPGAGWTDVTASIISTAYLHANRDDDGKVKIELSTSPTLSGPEYTLNPDVYLIEDTGINLKETEKQIISSNFKLTQREWTAISSDAFDPSFKGEDYEYDEQFGLELIYADVGKMFSKHSSPPLGILPEKWIEYPDESLWVSEVDAHEYEQNKYSQGWTEDQFSAELLLGSKQYRFYPINPEAEATAGVLNHGSIGASLLNNLNASEVENSFTNLLLKKANITADAGLKFYEAMLEQHREAIKKI